MLVTRSPFVLINRLEKIEEAAERFEQMLNGSTVLDSVLFFYGVPSIGKTTLLHEIRREASRRNIPSAVIDFDQEQHIDNHFVDEMYDDLNGQIRIAERLMMELARTANFIPSYHIDPDLSPNEAAEKLLKFALDLFRKSQKRPFVLFFDTIEESDPKTFLWVQEKILEPFLNHFPILIVIAGRTPPNTVERDLIYSLERRARKFHLRPFDNEQTCAQLVALGLEDTYLHDIDLNKNYTNGLPGLNEVAAHWLIDNKPLNQLLSYLVNKVIFRRLIHKVTADVKVYILAVSVLRQFDSGLLGRIINILWAEKYATSSIGLIRQLLKNLQQTRMVEPHPDGYGYAVPHDLRLILDRYLRETESQRHFQIHKIAARWFAEQVQQGDYIAIADRLYHLGGLWHDLVDHDNLAAQLEPDLQPEPSELERLSSELQAVLTELRTSSLRAVDLTNKIKSVLKQPEFKIIFDSIIIDALIDQCEIYNYELPLLS